MDREDVGALFRGLLGREPESEATVASFMAQDPMRAVAMIVGSAEFRDRIRKSPFDWYNAAIDAVGVIRSHADPARAPREGYAVNYFGLAIPRAVLPAVVRDAAEAVEADPLPANWHADIAEFAGALVAVTRARERFAMLELGCGWGCWMGITGAAARRRGLALTLIGIEGDERNLSLARETLAANGFGADEVRLVHGVAGARTGRAAFPQQAAGGEHWGLEPIFDTDERFEAAVADGAAAVLPVRSIADLAGDVARLDLVHIDIQGGEADLVSAAIGDLSERVAHVVVGTHSRPIEGRLFKTFGAAGWVLEVERPAILGLGGSEGPQVRVDGVQAWRNPRFG